VSQVFFRWEIFFFKFFFMFFQRKDFSVSMCFFPNWKIVLCLVLFVFVLCCFPMVLVQKASNGPKARVWAKRNEAKQWTMYLWFSERLMFFGCFGVVKSIFGEIASCFLILYSTIDYLFEILKNIWLSENKKMLN
jgi:hypothetical protein